MTKEDEKENIGQPLLQNGYLVKEGVGRPEKRSA